METKKTTDECIDDLLDLPVEEQEESPTAEVVQVKKVENSVIETAQGQFVGQSVSTVNKKHMNSDYDYTRESYYDVIEKGRAALDEFTDVAIQSQQPRAIEVLAGLMRAITETSAKLLDVHKERQLIERRENEQTGGGSTTHNHLTITSSDLLKLIEPKKPKTVEELHGESASIQEQQESESS